MLARGPLFVLLIALACSTSALGELSDDATRSEDPAPASDGGEGLQGLELPALEGADGEGAALLEEVPPGALDPFAALIARLMEPDGTEQPGAPTTPLDPTPGDEGGSSESGPGDGPPPQENGTGPDQGGAGNGPDGSAPSLLGALPAPDLPLDPLAELPSVPGVAGLVPGTLPMPAPGGGEESAAQQAPAMAASTAAPVPEIAERSPAFALAVGAALAAVTTAGLSAPLWAWLARLGATLRVLGVALYARLAGAKVLDHSKRSEIMDYLRAHPGACLTEIQDALEVGLTTVRYHLAVLQRNGLVMDVKSGRRRCYFAKGDGVPADARTAAAALSSASMRRVFNVIRVHPGIHQQELARALGVTPTSVIFHVKRLEEAGVIRRARCGREMAYFPVLGAAGSMPVAVPRCVGTASA